MRVLLKGLELWVEELGDSAERRAEARRQAGRPGPTNSRHRAGLSPLGVSGMLALFTSGRERVDVVGGERLAGYAPVAAANLFDGHPSDRP